MKNDNENHAGGHLPRDGDQRDHGLQSPDEWNYHLGNVRAIIKDNQNSYVATMEDEGGAVMSNPRVEEPLYFSNIEETAQLNAQMNHTLALAGVSDPKYAANLYWDDTAGKTAEDKAIGPAITLMVEAGDVINVEAWARYEKQVSYTRNVDVALLSALLGGTFVGTHGIDNVVTLTGTMEDGVVGAAFGDDSEDATPFAYVNYLLFDEAFQFVNGGAKRVGAAGGFDPGNESATNFDHVTLDAPIAVTARGYAYIWVSNESQGTKVWFDDFRVDHRHKIVTQATDYDPWGMVMREQRSPTDNTYRYSYQGQYSEKDLETGWNHFELREYDPIVGRWTAMDPARQYFSPYLGLNNNPVNGVDPDGAAWIPDEKGNLIAEAGDNENTLAQFLNISVTDAVNLMASQSYLNQGVLNLQAGNVLTVSNVFTQSIINSTSDLTLDAAIAGTSLTGPTPEDYYNCWGAAIAGSKGNTIQVGVGIPQGSTFDATLTSDYSPTTLTQAKFGSTVLRFADSNNIVQHGAVYYGKSSNGTVYVYTKNGWLLKPEVMKLSDLSTKIPSYGNVQGINSTNGGYYDPN